jgi:hypothetical protein
MPLTPSNRSCDSFAMLATAREELLARETDFSCNSGNQVDLFLGQARIVAPDVCTYACEMFRALRDRFTSIDA